MQISVLRLPVLSIPPRFNHLEAYEYRESRYRSPIDDWRRHLGQIIGRAWC